MAERTASRRNPGHLSSFRISLQTCWFSIIGKQLLTTIEVFYWEKMKKRRKKSEHCPQNAHRRHPPLVIVELLLHQEQVGFELVPLEDDVTHLLLGEARLVGVLVVARRLGRRLGGFAMFAGLMGRERERNKGSRDHGVRMRLWQVQRRLSLQELNLHHSFSQLE